MGYDPISLASLARVNILCVPLNRVPHKKFEEYVTALQRTTSIALDKVPGRSATVNATDPISDFANPAPRNFAKFTAGFVLFDVSTAVNLKSWSNVYPLEVNRTPQIILGLVEGAEIDSTNQVSRQSIIQQHKQRLEDFARGHPSNIIDNVLIFGGTKHEATSECLWTDASDDARYGIPGVLAELADMLYQRLPSVLERLRGPSSPLSRQSNHPQPSSMSVSNVPADRTSLTVGNAVPPSASQPDDMNSKYLILQGLLSLQVGQWPDALQYLAEGLSLTRTSGNYLWQARALEALAMTMLLFVWARLEFTIPQVCYPSSDRTHLFYPNIAQGILAAHKSTSVWLFSNTSTAPEDTLVELLPHIIGTVWGLYERAPVSSGTTTLAVLNGEARARWLSFLTVIHCSYGYLDDAAITTIVGVDRPGNFTGSTNSVTPTLKLQRSILLDVATEATLEAQTKLPIQLSTPIHIAIIRCIVAMGAHRKQGLFLREYLKRLIPSLTEARKIGAAETGVHPAASLSSLRKTALRHEYSHANSVRAILYTMIATCGLSATPPTEPLPSSQDRLRASIKMWVTAQNTGDITMKLDVLRLCVRVCDAVPDPEGSLIFTSMLLQLGRRTMTVPPHAPELPSLLSADEQSDLLSNVNKIMANAGDSGVSNVKALYWDPFLVRDIALVQDQLTDRLKAHAAQDLKAASMQDATAKRDPFIFNPFTRAKEINGSYPLIVGETAIFSILLQNPLHIEIDITNIKLLTHGCEFEASDHSIVLGPLSVQSFTLAGVPRAPGLLRVLGCRATLQYCYPEDFLILSDNWVYAPILKSRIVTHVGQALSEVPIPDAKEVSVEVKDHLPHLSLFGSTLQPAIMLLEGESARIQVTVRNDSSIDVDFVTLTFEDSVTSRLEEVLSNKDLLPADVYEIQHQISTSPVVLWKNEALDLTIPSGQSTTFDLEIFGRPGLTAVNVTIDYAHLGQPRDQFQGTFYTRQLIYAVTTTVNGSVDVPRCVIAPLQHHAWSLPNEKQELERIHGHRDNEDQPVISSKMNTTRNSTDACLVLFDLRNIWPQPLEVEIVSMNNGDTEDEVGTTPFDHVTEILQPGQLTRIPLLVPRQFVRNPRAMIPSLDSKRQFVVSGTKLTLEAEAANRETFWYRERLLNLLRGSWREPGTSRTGQLDLRKGVRLHSRSLDALMVEHVDVAFGLGLKSHTLHGLDPGTDLVSLQGSHYRLKCQRFATVSTIVHNRSHEDLNLILRLQPSLRDQAHNVALDLSKKLVWSGNLQSPIQPVLKAGESRTVNLGVVVLTAGDYEITGTVEEVTGHVSLAKSHGSKAALGSERRIWHARNACLIDVFDDRQAQEPVI